MKSLEIGSNISWSMKMIWLKSIQLLFYSSFKNDFCINIIRIKTRHAFISFDLIDVNSSRKIFWNWIKVCLKIRNIVLYLTVKWKQKIIADGRKYQKWQSHENFQDKSRSFLLFEKF